MRQPSRANVRAFTLLEAVVSMGVMVIIISVSLKVLLTVYESTEDLTSTHQANLLSKHFSEACRRAFAEVDSRSALEFDYREKGGKFDTWLSVGGTPSAFEFDYTKVKRVDHVLLAAEHRSDGWLRIGLYYLDKDEHELLKEEGFSSVRDYPYVELLPKARQFSWRFFNSEAEKWEQTIEGFNPATIELILSKPEDRNPSRYLFQVN